MVALAFTDPLPRFHSALLVTCGVYKVATYTKSRFSVCCGWTGYLEQSQKECSKRAAGTAAVQGGESSESIQEKGETVSKTYSNGVGGLRPPKGHQRHAMYSFSQ